jgi:1,4-alpha-glucan branching enzyme
MLEREALGNGKVRVTFRVSKHVWADCITLVGEFNNWDPHSHALRQTNDSADWQISLDLDAGCSYRFHYLVDGHEWMDDNYADGYEFNCYGGVDCIIRI